MANPVGRKNVLIKYNGFSQVCIDKIGKTSYYYYKIDKQLGNKGVSSTIIVEERLFCCDGTGGADDD
jgi:hypothetical protein